MRISSAEEARQAGAALMFTGRLLCLLGVASIAYSVYGMFMGYPQSTTLMFGLLSAVYLLGERHRRESLVYMSESIAQEFGLRDSAAQREEPGSVQSSWRRTLVVRYGMQMGVLLVSLGAMILTPVVLAVGKEVRTQERTADWTDLLSLSASMVVVIAALVGESRAYAMVIAPRTEDSPGSLPPVAAMVMWGTLALLPLAYVGARAAATEGGTTVSLDILPVYAMAASLAALCLARGNRVFRLYVRAKTSRVVNSPDEVQPRTFSLLLRPFDEDPRLLRDQQVFTAKTLIKGWFSIGVPEEQKICSALSWAGPPIAVGVPGEQLAPDGAARFYLPRHQWHATVTAMMVRARLVVLILGDSDGVAWELAEAFRVVPPQRLVLVVPVRGASGYTTLQKNLREAMRPHLKPTDQIPDFPEYGGGFGFSSRTQGIIYFTSGWRPVYAPLRAGLEPTDRLALSLARASIPIAAQLRQFESGMPSDVPGKQL
jgi:hypothetical protein